MTSCRSALPSLCVALSALACSSGPGSSPPPVTEPAVIDGGPAALPCNDWTVAEIGELREAAASTVFALDASDVAHFVGTVEANATEATSGGYMLHVRVDRGVTVTERVDFPPFETFSPRAVALDGQGALHVVGAGIAPSVSGDLGLVLRHFTNAGGAWAGETLGKGLSPALAVSTAGQVTVAYLAVPDVGADSSVKVLSNASSTWASVATPVATGNGAPVVSIDAAGDTRVAFATVNGVMVMSNETGLWAIRPASHEQSIGSLVASMAPDGLQLGYSVFTGTRIAHLDDRTPEHVEGVFGDVAMAIDAAGKRHLIGLATDRLTPVYASDVAGRFLIGALPPLPAHASTRTLGLALDHSGRPRAALVSGEPQDTPASASVAHVSYLVSACASPR